jgi:hypothetical protein
MDIRSKVLEIRNERNFTVFQAYFRTHPKEISDLVQLINEQEAYPIPEYASWILAHVSKENPFSIQPFYKLLIELLFLNSNQSVRRNLIHVIDQLELTPNKESEFIDLLISYIQDFENKVAVQVYSIQVLTKFVLRYPELKDEILGIIVLHSENKSPAYSASLRGFQRKTQNI